MNDEITTADESSAPEEAMLSAIEARILGSLMEKQLTTPDQYPLTLNSLVTACNQKTSREPVTNYSKGEIEHCINKMRDRKLIEVEYGSRANRYDQRLSRTLALSKPMQAAITIMLLRGPQTVSEVMNRSDRLYRFESATAIEELLATQCQKTSPIVVHIPRQGGQREDRYMHLLCGKPDLSQWSSASGGSYGEANRYEVNHHETNAELEARVEALERKLAQVMQALGIEDDDASGDNL